MRYLARSVLVGLMFGLTACASAAPAPKIAPPVEAPRPKASEPDDVVRWAELTRELAQKLPATVSCATVAAVMNDFVGAHAELRRLVDALATWERATPKFRVDSFYSKLRPALDVRIDAGIRCKNDLAARAAFDRFFAAAGLMP